MYLTVRINNLVSIVFAALVIVIPISEIHASSELPPLVTPRNAEAVKRGMEWLVSHQFADGSWGGGYWGEQYPVAMTALAGLALLSSGSTPSRGPYSEQILKAAIYLLSQQHKGGLIAGAGEKRAMYGHAFAMLFLANIYGMTGSPDLCEHSLHEQIRRALKQGIYLVQNVQTPLGGFGYEADAKGNDEGSVTVTIIAALRACQDAGIVVPLSIIAKNYDYLARCQNEDGGIRYSAEMSCGASRPPFTAAAIAALYSQSNEETPVAKKAWSFVESNMLGPSLYPDESYFFYTHFYLSQTLYFRGGLSWESYYLKLSDHLLFNQSEDGSWKGDGASGFTYGTSLALLMLQLPYEHVPSFVR